MLQNAHLLAKIGADTAESEQLFAELLPKTGNYPTGPPGRLAVPGALRFLLGPDRESRPSEEVSTAARAHRSRHLCPFISTEVEMSIFPFLKSSKNGKMLVFHYHVQFPI